MRGRRFGRPASKRKSAKDKRNLQQTSISFVESSPVDALQISSVTLNSLDHLGNQRFPLPPFSEHFQRWMKDVKSLLADFESILPNAIEQEFKENIEGVLSSLETSLNELSAREVDLSGELTHVQKELAAYENERSKLESDYKAATREARRRYEQSSEKIRREIERLESERLRILHAKPTILQRLFGSSNTNLEDRNNALRVKKETLAELKEALMNDLEKRRLEYETKRAQQAQQTSALHRALENSSEIKLDDALEIRKDACNEMSRQVREAVDRLLRERETKKA